MQYAELILYTKSPFNVKGNNIVNAAFRSSPFNISTIQSIGQAKFETKHVGNYNNILYLARRHPKPQIKPS